MSKAGFCTACESRSYPQSKRKREKRGVSNLIGDAVTQAVAQQSNDSRGDSHGRYAIRRADSGNPRTANTEPLDLGIRNGLNNGDHAIFTVPFHANLTGVLLMFSE